MPNGKPGDHPLIDVALHGVRVFSPEIDGLIREIVDMEGIAAINRRLDWFSLPGNSELQKAAS